MIGIRINDKKLAEIKQIWCSWFFRKDRINEFMDILSHDIELRQMIFTSNEQYSAWKREYDTKSPKIKDSIWRDQVTEFFFDDLSNEKYVISKYKKKLQKDTEDFFLKNYERYRESNKLEKVIQLMGIEVCPYCNRNFIEYYAVRNANNQRKMFFKGDLDHYYSKEEIPVLAISFFNLVPSCKVCNHEKSNSIKRTFYPFYDNEEDEYHFSIEVYDYNDKNDIVFEEPIENIEEKRFDSTVWQGISDNFNIKLNANNKKRLSERMENSKEVFRLEKKYNRSKEYVKEILRKRYIYSETHIENLLENFPEIFDDKTQILETLYSYCDNEKHMCNRPLSKLTKDILFQIGVVLE